MKLSFQPSGYKLADLERLFRDKYTLDELLQRTNKHQRKMVDEQSDLLLIQERSYRQGEKLEAIRQRLEALEGLYFYILKIQQLIF